jgi:hypothetical protein
MEISESIIVNYDFILPKGLVDANGQVHRRGRMRLVTAKDEIVVQNDQRTREIPGYAVILLLARVVVQLGELSIITPETLENLFSSDLVYLKTFFERINQQRMPALAVQCPQCRHDFQVNLSPGEFQATPLT